MEFSKHNWATISDLSRSNATPWLIDKATTLEPHGLNRRDELL